MSLIFAIKNLMNTKIPNHIILTWKNKDIPKSVITNLQKLNPDKQILFFTDDDIISFLNADYNQQFINHFNSIEQGCYKADFFRYCFLYRYGGYYCDIDIEHIAPINTYVTENTDIFTVISQIAYGHIFQALLYTIPNHIVIKNCIEDMFRYGPNPPIVKNYFGHPTTCMYNNIQNHINKPVKQGYYNDTNIQLAQEILYYNRHICIYDNKPIAFSRYQNYTRKDGFIT